MSGLPHLPPHQRHRSTWGASHRNAQKHRLHFSPQEAPFYSCSWSLPHMLGAAQAAVGPGSPGSQPGSCGLDPQENLPQNSHRSFLPIFPTGIFWTPKVSQSPHHDHLCLFHGYNHLSHLTETIEFCLDLSVVDSCVSVLIPVRWAPN